MKFIERIKIFIWLTTKGKLLTDCERARRNMTAETTCPTCNDGEESLDHLFRGCNFAKDCWRKCLSPRNFRLDSHIPFLQWVETNCTNNSWVEDNRPWCSKFVHMLWGIWKARNAGVFNNTWMTSEVVVKNAERGVDEAVTYLMRRGMIEGGS